MKYARYANHLQTAYKVNVFTHMWKKRLKDLKSALKVGNAFDA